MLSEKIFWSVYWPSEFYHSNSEGGADKGPFMAMRSPGNDGCHSPQSWVKFWPKFKRPPKFRWSWGNFWGYV